MLVKEVMNPEPVCINSDDFIVDVIKLFRKKRVRGAPVIEKNMMIGILTERDILDFMEVHPFGKKLVLPAPFDLIESVIDSRAQIQEVEKEFNKLKHSTVKDIMTKEVITASPFMHVSEAADLMSDNNITHLPVVEKGKLAGIVTPTDLMKSLV